jgi:hypothetical protein
MQSWQSTFLGIRALPRDLSAFELQAFFTFDADKRRLIETRRSDAHRLGLALHIGFIRLSAAAGRQTHRPSKPLATSRYRTRRCQSRDRLAQSHVPARSNATRTPADGLQLPRCQANARTSTSRPGARTT